MKSLDCTLKLASDTDNVPASRIVELTITGEKTNGTWSIVADSPDSRLNIGESSGVWSLAETPQDSGNWTLYLLRSNDLRVLVEMYGLAPNFLSRIFCGQGWGGEAWHQGPPTSTLSYDLEFLCS